MLRQAADAAYRVGAKPIASRGETELRATGAKPRRVVLTGLEALTAAERRSAELIADSLTDAQIAQTVFVTARTVEGHLTHVLLKLDVKARTELAAALVAPAKPRPVALTTSFEKSGGSSEGSPRCEYGGSGSIISCTATKERP
jgi:DNA-binding CsgD family transcriptional regulator